MITHDNERLCDDCYEPVADEDAAPVCGSHDLHVDCACYFVCRDCDDVRAEPDPDLERKAQMENYR